MPIGENWVNTSYDYLFRFGVGSVTNQVVLILMDTESFDLYGQTRGQPWDRKYHTALLNRLADDGCSMVVMDIWFRVPDPAKDPGLAAALQRQRRVVLMAMVDGFESRHVNSTIPDLEAAHPSLPTDSLVLAASNHWGVAWLDTEQDSIVRHHWPVPAPGPQGLPSLPWVAAQLAEAHLDPEPQERWLRYYDYGQNGPWDRFSYRLAMEQRPNYFRNKIVFIGNKPQNSAPKDREFDKFSVPFTRWTGEAVGGVEILATAFLNLVNDDWMRRPAWWIEMSILCSLGILLGGSLCRVHPARACILAAGLSVLAMLAGVWLSQATNYWFPWLVVAGGQVPCALAWALLGATVSSSASERTTIVSPITLGPESAGYQGARSTLPGVTDYEIFDPPFGEGAYGRVWLARNAIGQWQALKAVYVSQFGSRTKPYDREFDGISRYKPISDKHPGLLRVDFVSKKKREGYFYYVMELGDALEPGWEKEPRTYRPRDLARVRAKAHKGRLPAQECLRIGISLAEALDFLHSQSLIHCDIKPQNIIFVKGNPKLADVGLVAEVLPPGQDRTWLGTPGYMPPPPEPPGTPQADIYALGMVLYVIFTGRGPDHFPDVATTLVDSDTPTDFVRLNAVILKACQPDLKERFASAREMAEALRAVQAADEEGLGD